MASLATAQTSTISGLIQDPNGQAFVNGTCTIQFWPPSGQVGPFLVNGSTFNQNPSCTFDGSGNISATVTRNDFISPGGSMWNFTVCPAVDSFCTSSLVSIISSSMNVSTSLNPNIAAIIVNTRNNPVRGYSDSEIVATPNPGTIYYNVITGALRFWNGSTWTALGVAGGGTVSQINTIAPLSGGPITTTGTVSCPTCAIANTTINTIPYLSALRTYSDSPLTRINSTTVGSGAYQLTNGSIIQETAGGALSLTGSNSFINFGPFASPTWQISNIGTLISNNPINIISVYRGVPTQGGGVSAIYGSLSNDTDQTASIPDTTIYTNGQSMGSFTTSIIRISVYISSHGTCTVPGPAGVVVGLKWTDIAGNKSITSLPLDVNGSTTLTGTVPLGDNTSWGSGTVTIKDTIGTPIKINTTLTACTTGTATYQIDVFSEQLR